MRDSIYTIPVNEVFEPKCGCPICQLRNTLEERSVEYIMGAAMMEPDVRVETNKHGFCKGHYDMMMKRKNRLSLALMLESRLIEVQENLTPGEAPNGGGLFRKKEKMKTDSCFVCNKIDWALERMFDTVLKLYAAQPEFQALYREQEYLCLQHYKQITGYAQQKIDKKALKAFLKDSETLCHQYLDEVKQDVSHYCKMFDYRNSGADADWGNSKDSIERAIYFLTSRDVD